MIVTWFSLHAALKHTNVWTYGRKHFEIVCVWPKWSLAAFVAQQPSDSTSDITRFYHLHFLFSSPYFLIFRNSLLTPNLILTKGRRLFTLIDLWCPTQRVLLAKASFIESMPWILFNRSLLLAASFFLKNSMISCFCTSPDIHPSNTAIQHCLAKIRGQSSTIHAVFTFCWNSNIFWHQALELCLWAQSAKSLLGLRRTWLRLLTSQSVVCSVQQNILKQSIRPSSWRRGYCTPIRRFFQLFFRVVYCRHHLHETSVLECGCGPSIRVPTLLKFTWCFIHLPWATWRNWKWKCLHFTDFLRLVPPSMKLFSTSPRNVT